MQSLQGLYKLVRLCCPTPKYVDGDSYPFTNLSILKTVYENVCFDDRSRRSSSGVNEVRTRIKDDRRLQT